MLSGVGFRPHVAISVGKLRLGIAGLFRLPAFFRQSVGYHRVSFDPGRSRIAIVVVIGRLSFVLPETVVAVYFRRNARDDSNFAQLEPFEFCRQFAQISDDLALDAA